LGDALNLRTTFWVDEIELTFQSYPELRNKSRFPLTYSVEEVKLEAG